MCCYFYLLEITNKELASMIAFLKKMEKGGWDDDEYMLTISSHESRICAAWVACRLIGDSIGQGLIEARLRESWDNWESELASYERSYQIWATVLLDLASATTETPI
jgi:hypothetical protein